MLICEPMEASGFGHGDAYVHSAHCVNFDVDIGHVIEASWPRKLTAAEETTLCFAAMPDSQPSSGGLGDSCFAFHFLSESGRALWGFSLFRARRESSQRRGVFQKSLVLLSDKPFFQLFRSAVTLLADAYFASGSKALSAALRSMDAWPPAHQPGLYAGLGLLQQTLTLATEACEAGPVFALPCAAPASAPNTASDATCTAPAPASGPSGALREPVAVRSLCALGGECWTLWQLLLTGESLVVLTPSPHQCSDIVLALPALIAPLPCMSNVRPYLTVHAPDWEVHLTGTGPPPGSGLLVGATNPMLSRNPPAWLSLLVLEAREASASTAAAASQPPLPSVPTQGGGLGLLFGFGPSAEVGRADAALSGSWAAARWKSHVEVVVRADEHVLHRLREAEAVAAAAAVPLAMARSAASSSSSGGGGDDGGTAGRGDRLLREHFEQLTLSFLQPLERFTTMGSLQIGSHMRPTAEGGGGGANGDGRESLGLMLHEWSYEAQTRFLREVEAMEPPPLPRSIVPQRADLLRLYTAFLRTPHFAQWWESRRRRVDAGLYHG